MLSGALPELLCIYIYIYIASLRRLAGRTALSLKRTTGPMVDRRSRWLCQPAHMARELFRDLVWSASSDELVQGEGHLVLGTGVLHILPGYGCGVGHGVLEQMLGMQHFLQPLIPALFYSILFIYHSVHNKYTLEIHVACHPAIVETI